MKTDRFSDIIRRKLESIRPEFSEKDWTRMQASLQTGVPQPATPTTGQPFSGGVWTAKSWLMAAATVSAVVLVGFSFWQHREINQLRQTIGQLNKQSTQQTAQGQSTLSAPNADTPILTHSGEKLPQPNRDEPATTPDNKAVPQSQLDTVYITHYVAVPSKSHVVPPEEKSVVDRPDVVPDRRYATNNTKNTSTAQPDQSDNSTSIPKIDAYGEPSTSSNTIHENTNNSSVTSTKSTSRSARERRVKEAYIVENRKTKGRRDRPVNSSDNQGASLDNMLVKTTPDPPSSTNVTVESNEPSTSASYELVKSLPIANPGVNWNGMLAQRARRMRPTRTTVVGGAESASAPESQPVVRLATRFRVGVGGEIASKLLSAGAFTEVILGKHWTVSAGLSQATYSGEKFVNDFDFDVRMRRDFRKEFAHGVDPRREIYNIATQTTRLQIPVTVGYRIPLSRGLTLIPNVGTYLNLSSSENATYYCPVLIPQRGFEEISTTDKRSVDLINRFAFGAGLEWQGGHWVIQGTPLLSMPIQNMFLQPDNNWQKSTTVGLRARVLYQF